MAASYTTYTKEEYLTAIEKIKEAMNGSAKNIAGYYVPRYAKGYLDDLEVKTIAYSLGNKKVLMINVPVCGVKKEIYFEYCKKLRREQVLRAIAFLCPLRTPTRELL